ncbi:MAG TPA: tetratricopeptide repeat protein [Acidimicrobiia bacterium]
MSDRGTGKAAVDDPRTVQEEERDFLLRSLDDLEAERDAGNIDDETYRRLHDDYTARAAIALRAMEDGKDTDALTDDLPSTSRRHRILVIGGLVLFAVVAATTMAFALGARLPGDTITGRSRGQVETTTKDRLAALQAVAAKNPTNGEARLAVARFRLGQRDLAGALKDYQAAATLAPTNAEPYAYSGWIIRLQGYPDQAMEVLDKAVTVDPSYPDAHFFRGFILLRDQKNPEAAIPELQQYLVAAPDTALADQVRALLAEAVKAAKRAKK